VESRAVHPDSNRRPWRAGGRVDRYHDGLIAGDVGGLAVRGNRDQSGSPADRDRRARGVRGCVDRCHCAPRPFDTYTVCTGPDTSPPRWGPHPLPIV
jgi:hypothetical protein